ncbi:hypothetical protein AGMMS49592_3370 [Endomicrobiia bacterium]|nr:hypothetical protein AGMMS49592_3370 [Endomicrobiia bacterium]
MAEIILDTKAFHIAVDKISNQLAILVDRGFWELPIEEKYVGIKH